MSAASKPVRVGRELPAKCSKCGGNRQPSKYDGSLCGPCRQSPSTELGLTGGQWVPVRGVQVWRPAVAS